MADEAMDTGTARLPSWATAYQRSSRVSMFVVYALSFIAALDIFTPIPGLIAIAIAGWHVHRRHRRAALALVVALTATIVATVQYGFFLHTGAATL